MPFDPDTMPSMKSLVHWYFKALELVMVLCLAAMCVMVFGNVVLRHAECGAHNDVAARARPLQSISLRSVHQHRGKSQDLRLAEGGSHDGVAARARPLLIRKPAMRRRASRPTPEANPSIERAASV